jgi:hypothetical protein
MLGHAVQEQEAMEHRSAMERLRQQREELGALLGQKREAVSLRAGVWCCRHELVHEMTLGASDLWTSCQECRKSTKSPQNVSAHMTGVCCCRCTP